MCHIITYCYFCVSNALSAYFFKCQYSWGVLPLFRYLIPSREIPRLGISIPRTLRELVQTCHDCLESYDAACNRCACSRARLAIRRGC